MAFCSFTVAASPSNHVLPSADEDRMPSTSSSETLFSLARFLRRFSASFVAIDHSQVRSELSKRNDPMFFHALRKVFCSASSASSWVITRRRICSKAYVRTTQLSSGIPFRNGGKSFPISSSVIVTLTFQGSICHSDAQRRQWFNLHFKLSLFW
jgi:hypothetical protein